MTFRSFDVYAVGTARCAVRAAERRNEGHERYACRGGAFRPLLRGRGHHSAMSLTQVAFTLIELILAVAVMSIVLISINAVFFAALRLHDSTDAAVDGSLPIQQALTTMRRDLQGVIPPSANGVMSGDFKVGGVQSTGLNLPVDIEISTTTGVMKDSEPWGDVQRVTYELKPPMDVSQPGRDLYRSVTRNVLANVPAQPDDQWLLSNVQSVEYGCFDGTGWENFWDSTTTTNIPLAVRVRIYLAAGPNAGTPIEMVVPLDQQSRTNAATVTGATSTSTTGG